MQGAGHSPDALRVAAVIEAVLVAGRSTGEPHPMVRRKEAGGGLQAAENSPDPLRVAAVNDVDDGLCVGIVAAPVWPDAGLPPEVPHLKLRPSRGCE